MPGKKSNKKFVIDTNILIYFSIFTPMQIHKTFWKQLSESISGGKIIIIEDVAAECKTAPLKPWVQEQKMVKITEDIRHQSFNINKQYKLITKREGIYQSEADPVIIAYAKENNCAVFSYEVKKQHKAQSNKIPDVCEKLNIPYMRSAAKVFTEIEFGII